MTLIPLEESYVMQDGQSEPQPPRDIILERGMLPKQDHGDYSLGFFSGERDALVLPGLLGQEEVNLSCG